MKIGAYLGKFYPPHLGHLQAIEYSLQFCDKLLIIISKNDKRNAKFLKDGFEVIDADIIKKWFEEYYKDNKKIEVSVFDETNLEPYPLDQDIWAEKFKDTYPQVNVKIADESYRAFNEKYFPDYEFLPIDRDIIPIHSTMIRNDIVKYFDYIIPTAQSYFEKLRSKNG